MSNTADVIGDSVTASRLNATEWGKDTEHQLSREDVKYGQFIWR